MSRKDDGKGMLPVREQARMARNAFRWAYWPRSQPVWLNVFDLLLIPVFLIVITMQLWLVLLIAFFARHAAGIYGRRGL